MDGERFDNLTKALATRRSRRSIFGLAGAAVGGLFGGSSKALGAPKADKPSKCYGEGSSCTNAKQCCSGTCTNRRCAAPPAPQCAFATDCPGSDTECRSRSCVSGVCGFVNTPAGTPTSQQTAGDCRKNVCDGSGAVTSVPDDADRPEDNNGCTTDSCLNGVPSHTPKPEGTACGDGGGAVCDATGTCVGCLTASDCPGSDTECQTRSCNGGICGAEFAPQGTPTSDQTSGDCRQNVCDGAGGVILIADNADVPADDGNQCTADTCVDGVPTFSPVPAGEGCGQNGGTVCNGAGQCVQCLSPTTCPGADTTCQQRTCNGGVCGVINAPQGVACGPNQICNGAGGCVELICPSGRANCDSNAGNRCETDTVTDVRNCGGCRLVCPAGPNSSPTCQSGICGLVCNSGFSNCNGNPADGCECRSPAICNSNRCCTPAGVDPDIAPAPCCSGQRNIFTGQCL